MFKRFFVAALVLSPMAGAETPPEFPVLAEFGGNYWVETNQPLPADTQFKVAFDVGDGAEPGKLNYNIHSLARFLNMHVRHGVARDNIQLALVVHGKATKDLLTNAHYQQEFGTDNGSEALIQALLNNNTQVYVCGQSASHYGVTQDKLIEGVQISLSAMTQHALLQQQGYTLNPF